MTDRPAPGDIKIEAPVTTALHQLRAPVGDFVGREIETGERAQAIYHAEQALTICEQIEDPNAAKVRAKLAAWREQTNT